MEDSRADAYKGWNHVRAESILQQAEEHLRLGQVEKACQLARESLLLDDEYDDARLVLARALIERGEYRGATLELEKVMSRQPGSIDALYLLGVAAEKTGNLPVAIAHYQDAYNLDNERFDTVLATTEVMASMGQISKARRYLAAHMDQADGDVGAYELAGRLAKMDGDHGVAAEHFALAYEADVMNVAYLEEMALAQVFAGQYAVAAESLTIRTHRTGRDVPLWVGMMLGDCHLELGNHASAKAAFQAVCRDFPEESDAWAGVSKVLLVQGKYDESIRMAEKALELTPNDVEAAMLAGYAALKLDQPARAVKILSQAISRTPDDYTLLCIMGQAMEAQGNIAEATRYYQVASNLKPNAEIAEGLLAQTQSVATTALLAD